MKTRLDQLLVEKALCQTREKARAVIMSGSVYVDGQRKDKPGTAVMPDAAIEIRGGAPPFVSRGGLKLQKALDCFGIDPAEKRVLDAGASTGGFTDCLLQRGAAHVYAVDVGYGQLAWKLREDRRVTCLERTNMRYVTPEQVDAPLDMAVMDLSFISLKLVLPVIRGLLRENAPVICLVKPQFEAGREKVGKKGVVKDPAVHREVLSDLTGWAAKEAFTVMGITHSPIKGPEGNIEFLLWLRTGSSRDETPPDAAAAADLAHKELNV